MANVASGKTIGQFPPLDNLTDSDKFIVEATRGGNTNTYYTTLSLILSNSSANIVVSNVSILSANTFIVRNKQTPSSPTMTVTKGTLMYDDDYLYVATANNRIKRIAFDTLY